MNEAMHPNTCPSPTQRFRAWIIAGAAALLLYRSTMAPGLLWGDSGEAQLHLLLGGWYVQGEIVRSHVLYYAVCRVVVFLGITPPVAANFVAALAGAVTIANAAWLATSLCRTRIAVTAAVIALMCSHTLWQLSTGAEVVTLTTALMTAELIALVKLIESRRIRWVFLIALFNGLGVSNHNFALLMWPVYLVLALRWWSNWRGDRGRCIALAASGFLIGAAPVLAMCIDHLATHGDPAASFESFLVGRYGSNVGNAGRLPQLLLRSGLAFALNFPSPLLLVGAVGAIAIRSVQSVPVRWALWLGGAIHLLFAARYDVPDQHTFLVPTFVFFSLMIAVGLDRWPAIHAKGLVRVAVILCALTAPLVYAAAPPLLRRYAPSISFFPQRDVAYRDPFDWFIQPWRAGYDGPERFAREALAIVPPDAMLIVDSTLYSPVNYLQAAESLRRDVRLDCVLARQDWLPPLDTDVEQYRADLLAGGRLCAGSDVKRYQPHWLRAWIDDGRVRFEQLGPIYKIVPVGRENR